MGADGRDWLRSRKRQTRPAAERPAIPPGRPNAQRVESWLQKHGVDYAPASPIPMAAIDEKRSRANQARKEAILSDSVERFVVAWRAGAVFPPIVVYPLGDRVVIIDGNNRHASARKAGLETIDGIVIGENTSSETIALLTVEANAHHGVTPELSWRLHQAFYLCGLGFDDHRAAEASGVTPTQLRTARLVAEADQRARAMKIAGFADLTIAGRQSLASLHDEAVFYQAGRLAATTDMNTNEIRDLVRELKALTSEGARVAHIGTVAESRGIEAAARKAIGRSSRRVSSPKTSLVTGIGMLLRIDPGALVGQIVTIHDRDLVNQRLSLLETKVLDLQVAMETLKGLEG